jgi:hypothetical protein
LKRNFKLCYLSFVRRGAEDSSFDRKEKLRHIDASFKRPEDRAAAVSTGLKLRIPVLIVECRADQQEVLRLLRERASKGTGPSDATEEVYLRQRTEFVPISEVSERQHLVVDTTEGTERVLPHIENALSHLFDSSEISTRERAHASW